MTFKFQKKPIVVEAIQVGSFAVGQPRFNSPHWPQWLIEAKDKEKGLIGAVWLHQDKESYAIGTLEGVVQARAGDFIIQGIQGELYPCKPDIFEQTYDRIDVADDNPDLIAVEKQRQSGTFAQELVSLINRNSIENRSNTPDWILADYIMDCLRAFDMAVHYREEFHGRPGTIGVTQVVHLEVPEEKPFDLAAEVAAEFERAIPQADNQA